MKTSFSGVPQPHRFSREIAAALLILGASTAWSQVNPAKPVQFPIQGFDISGDNPLGNGETAKVLAPFLRADASIDTLQNATSALESALREKGFGLYRVSLPPQEVSGTVKLQIVQFTLDKITIENQGTYTTENIRRSVPELREKSTPNFRRLAVQTTIANESPAKQITVSLKESDAPDKVDATIGVSPAKPWNLVISANNTGNASSGKDRLTVSGSHSNLWDLDHQFTGAYTTSVSRPGDVKQYGLSYRIPFYQAGGVASISHTRSDVVGSFGAFNSTGAGHTFGVNYSIYMPAQGNYRSYVSLSFDDKLYKGTLINGVPVSLDTRSRAVSASYTGKSDSDTSAWNYSVEIASNIPGGRGNDLFSYTNAGANTDIVEHRWHALRVNGQYLQLTPSKWTWSIRGNAQYISQAVIPGEQFGFGGASSLRGTQERAMTGDKGYFASAELTTPELSSGLKASTFMDTGRTSNLISNGVNKLASDGLSSAGVGLRYNSSGLSLSVDYARITKGSAVPLSANSNSPQKGDEKLHVNASWRF